MSFPVPLRILLICLVIFCPAVDGTLEQNILMAIVKNLEKQLRGQYALAFSVEMEKCLKDSKYTGQDLITEEVKKELEKNNVYQGDHLLAAKPKKISTNNGLYTEHAEFRLQNFLKNILKKEDRCVIYFTVNSPCMEKCLKEDGRFNIKTSLQLLEQEKLKAFVFKKYWKDDKDPKAVIARLKEIAPNLPYYQCDSECKAL
ncbi:uncharacterized protein LOC127162470 [Labeo rohita]|uniref:uncharacterized protein LOC127162470 n=1 Tax=Labeo rohita TaxID=84645 RepID=UPI0021E30FB5|nr:uncharacterized protein LOC127162470 [Labeo rohita]